MSFSLPLIPQQGSFPSMPDLLAAVKQLLGQPASLSSAGTTDTLTAAQMLSPVFVRSGATSAVTSTTDTAANIVAALGANVYVGQTFLFFYVNLNTTSGAVTVAAGSGVTTTGTLTIPVAGLRVFMGTVTNITSGSQAVVLNGVFSIGSGVAA
jgi:hypothetical protein